MPRIHQRHRQTDGRTDGRTAYDSNTALALRASRGKNAVLWFNAVLLSDLSASEMTYIVSGGALNSTHSLTHAVRPTCICTRARGAQAYNGGLGAERGPVAQPLVAGQGAKRLKAFWLLNVPQSLKIYPFFCFFFLQSVSSVSTG